MAVTTVGKASLVEANLIISRGADNVYAFRWNTTPDPKAIPLVKNPVDLSTYTARSQIRDVTGGAVWLQITDIDLDASGNIVITIPAATTEAAAWDAYHSGVWDIELVDANNVVTRFAAGQVTVSQDVTRA